MNARWLAWLFLATVATLALLEAAYGVAGYRECRRVHPAWYCIAL